LLLYDLLCYSHPLQIHHSLDTIAKQAALTDLADLPGAISFGDPYKKLYLNLLAQLPTLLADPKNRKKIEDTRREHWNVIAYVLALFAAPSQILTFFSSSSKYNLEADDIKLGRHDEAIATDEEDNVS